MEIKAHEKITKYIDMMQIGYKLIPTCNVILKNMCRFDIVFKKPGTIETPEMSPRFAKYLCKATQELGPVIVKLAHQMSEDEANGTIKSDGIIKKCLEEL